MVDSEKNIIKYDETVKKLNKINKKNQKVLW